MDGYHRPQHLSTRLHFLWIKEKAAPYAALSLALAQEVLAFLWFQSVLVFKCMNDFYTLDCISGQLLFLCVLNRRYGSGQLQCALSLGENNYIIGVAQRPSESTHGPDIPTTFFQVVEQIATMLPYITAGRVGFGAIFDPQRERICVFGGMTVGSELIEKVSSSSEQLRLLSKTWEALPDLIHPRICFTPCSYRRLFFIIGGGNETIEVFNPVVDSIALLPFQLPERPTGCASFAYQNCILVMTESCTYGLTETGVLWGQQRSSLLTSLRPLTPILASNGHLYIPQAADFSHWVRCPQMAYFTLNFSTGLVSYTTITRPI